MWSLMRVMAVSVMLLTVLTACSGDDGESSTTTTTPAVDGVTTLPEATTSDGGSTTSGSTTTTTGVDTTVTTEADSLPEYRIAYRGEDDESDTVVVLLDPASYTSLSDIDLQEVIRDVYDRFPPVATAFVVDTDDAVSLVLLDRALTEDEQSVLDDHYFARLEDGLRIVFVGQFDEYPIAILGS